MLATPCRIRSLANITVAEMTTVSVTGYPNHQGERRQYPEEGT